MYFCPVISNITSISPGRLVDKSKTEKEKKNAGCDVIHRGFNCLAQRIPCLAASEGTRAAFSTARVKLAESTEMLRISV